MSKDDEEDLGSFFAEISEIEATVQSTEADIVGKPHVITHVVAASAAPQINKQSHPVYTYSAPDTIPPPPPPATSHNQPWSDPSKSSSLSSFVTQYQHYSTTTVSSSATSNDQLQNKKFVRTGGGETWVDDSLNEWPDNDFRIFVGDLGKEVSTDLLTKAFQHYKSFAKAKVVKTKVENKGRGYGFVSFIDPMDCAKAIREMNGKYLGSRPMKIRKSTWQERDIDEVKKNEKKKRKFEESLGLS